MELKNTLGHILGILAPPFAKGDWLVTRPGSESMFPHTLHRAVQDPIQNNGSGCGWSYTAESVYSGGPREVDCGHFSRATYHVIRNSIDN